MADRKMSGPTQGLVAFLCSLGVVAIIAGAWFVGFRMGEDSARDENRYVVSQSQVATAGGNSLDAATTTAPPPVETAAPYVPVPTDFSLEVIELERSCFGNAGCNIVYRINPTYIGAQPPDPTERYTVTFDLQGANAAESGSFTISGGESQTAARDSTQVPPGGVLVAVPTRVLAG